MILIVIRSLETVIFILTCEVSTSSMARYDGHRVQAVNGPPGPGFGASLLTEFSPTSPRKLTNLFTLATFDDISHLRVLPVQACNFLGPHNLVEHR